MSRRPAGVFLLLGLALALGTGACHEPAAPTPPCTLAIAPPGRAFPSDGGLSTIVVTTSAPLCDWTAASGAVWVTITSGASGIGSGTVQYAVAANSSPAGRATTIAVGSELHAISQEGRPAPVCTYALQPSNAPIASDGGTGSFQVETQAGCTWTAVPTEAWITVTAGASGTGPGVVTYRVEHNASQAERTGTIVEGGQTFAIVQAGELPPVSCDYSVAPVDFAPCMAGGALTTRLTTSASCPWTVTSNASWLTVQSGSSGNGTVDVRLDYSSNYDAPRAGVVFVRWPTPSAGQNVRVAQAGCYYAVTRQNITVGSGGTSEAFDVLQQSDPIICGGATQDRCLWSAVSDVPWIVVTSSMPRAGDDRVSFTVQPNPDPVPRIGTITVRDKRVTVAQAGR